MNDVIPKTENMINLGLTRISRLLTCLGNPQLSWSAVHVAGTNGKGSVCAYISNVIHSSNILSGRFTSPYLINRWDCIHVVGKSIDQQTFLNVEDRVKKINKSEQIAASPFEILTATAFEIFRLEKIKIAVIEVGLGGLDDSTNILSSESVICSAITKIDLDHQGFLGDSVEEIASHKAGIIKFGVPCVVDGSNEASVLSVIRETCEKNGSRMIIAGPENHIKSPLLGSYQKNNLGVALEVLKIVQQTESSITSDTIEQGISSTTWPGRLQKLKFNGKYLLLDGAHNIQAACLLREFINSEIRPFSPKITWIIGFSKPGDSFIPILHSFGIESTDTVHCTEFGPVDDMPWVYATDVQRLTEEAKKITEFAYPLSTDTRVFDYASFQKAIESTENHIIVCGSLYLVADVLRRIEL